MPPWIASIIFTAGIAGLFYLDRDRKRIASAAIWIPTAWLFVCLSRPLTDWLGLNQSVDLATTAIEGSPVDAAFFEALEVLALGVLIARRERVGTILRRNLPIFVFFIYAALSISWSDFPFVTLKHWIKGVGDVMMILIILTERDPVGALKRIITFLAFVLLPISVLWIKYYPQLGRQLTLSWTESPIGVAQQKNSLGELCDILGLALLWRFRSIWKARESRSRRRRLVALGASMLMVVWLLWQCDSMTSISALAMASSVMMVSVRPIFRRNRPALHILAAAVPALSSYALFFQSSGSLIQGLGRNPSLTGRTDIWEAVLSVPNHRLIGTGYESFWLGPRLQRMWDTFPGLRLNESHNGYVEILISLGWIGAALLGVLIFAGYKNVVATYRRDPDLGSFTLALFLSAVVTGFTEAAFRMLGPPWLVFLLASMAAPVSLSRASADRKGGSRQSSRVAGQPVFSWDENPVNAESA